MRQATTLECQAKVIQEMVKRERRYFVKARRTVKAPADRSSPVSVMNPHASLQDADTMIIRKGVCEWMYRVSLS